MSNIFPKKFKDVFEWQLFLDNFDVSYKQETTLSAVYFLVKDDNNNIIPVYFYKPCDWWFASVCMLSSRTCALENVEEYVRETYEKSAIEEALIYEKMLYIGGVHYTIENFQNVISLPIELEIVDVLTETECLKWMLNNNF